MKPREFMTHPKLRKFVRSVPAGDYLFRQDEAGTSMFLVLDGFIELVAEKDGSGHRIGLLEAGEFLGEKAFLRKEPYRRVYSARAECEATVLEISHRELEFMKIAAPELMLNVMVQAFAVALRRLEHMNYLAQVLRSSDNRRRVVGCVLYYCRAMGKTLPQGLDVYLPPSAIQLHVDMGIPAIVHVMQDLVDAGLLRRSAEANRYVVPNLAALKAYWEGAPAQAA